MQETYMTMLRVIRIVNNCQGSIRGVNVTTEGVTEEPLKGRILNFNTRQCTCVTYHCGLHPSPGDCTALNPCNLSFSPA